MYLLGTTTSRIHFKGNTPKFWHGIGVRCGKNWEMTAKRKSYMRNRLIPNWMTLTFIYIPSKVMSIVPHSPLNAHDANLTRSISTHFRLSNKSRAANALKLTFMFLSCIVKVKLDKIWWLFRRPKVSHSTPVCRSMTTTLSSNQRTTVQWRAWLRTRLTVVRQQRHLLSIQAFVTTTCPILSAIGMVAFMYR